MKIFILIAIISGHPVNIGDFQSSMLCKSAYIQIQKQLPWYDYINTSGNYKCIELNKGEM